MIAASSDETFSLTEDGLIGMLDMAIGVSGKFSLSENGFWDTNDPRAYPTMLDRLVLKKQ